MYADIIFKSNAIFTGTENRPQAGFVAVKDNKILEVGKADQASEFQGPDTKILSCEDKMVMPGFIDSHFHFSVGRVLQSKYFVDLTESKSEEDAVEMIKQHLENDPSLDHIFAFGWFITNWTDHKLPSKKSLDEAFPDIPVVTSSVDGHTHWVNSKALEASNIAKETTVNIGQIGKDADGELNGLLYEIEAAGYIEDTAFAMSPEEREKVQNRMFEYLAECGVTSIAEMANSPVMRQEPAIYTDFLKSKKEGKLTARVHLYPSLGDHPDFSLAKQIRDKYQYPDLKVCGLKQFVDGTTSLYTGCMLEPYTDNPNELGKPNYPPELFDTMIAAANKEGFGVRLHAIGDRAVRIVLDACEKSTKENDLTKTRNCVEHAESINPSDIPRFAETNTIASMQIVHLPLDANEKTERVGKERARYEWPLRSLLDAGTILSAGTDYPVFEVNPMYGVYSAITRCLPDGTPVGSSPEEKITLSEILRAYTWGGAYSVGREKELGTLEKGKLADIVVLNNNLFQLSPEQILKVKPVMTMMGGKFVFENQENIG